MIKLSSHNCIRAMMIALCMALFVAAPVLAWDEVYADTAGQGDMTEVKIPPPGIYVISGETGDLYLEWLGEGELPGEAVLILEKKKEMTDEESDQYDRALNELIGDPPKEGGEPDGSGADGEKSVPGADGEKNVPGADGEKSGFGPAQDPAADPTVDPTTDPTDPTVDPTVDPADPIVDPTDPVQDPTVDPTAAPGADAVGDEGQQTRNTYGTRDVVPTGVFTGSRMGMILMAILVAFAAAIILRRTRREERYTDDI